MSALRATVGPFLLGEELGAGASARVWRGVHRPTGTAVAVKVIDVDPASAGSFRADFHNEVRSVAALQHPGIVVVHDCGEVTDAEAAASGGGLSVGQPWIAMELVEGRAEPDRLLPFDVVRDRLRQVLGALAHAHAHAVLHRDIKPGNILISPDGYAKLVDFGIASRLDAATPSNPRVATAAGTPLYMAPELFEETSAGVGTWTDLYALGCVAYELTAGAPPFAPPNLVALLRAHLMDAPPPLPRRPDLPSGFEAWIGRLLAKDPADRFARADEALRELDSLCGVRVGPRLRLRRSPPALRPRVEALSGTGLGLFGLRSPPVVGREAEQAALWAALVGVGRRSRARVVVLHGDEGAGKTRLADWVAAEASESAGFEVLRGRCGAAPQPGRVLRRVVRQRIGADSSSTDDLQARADAWMQVLAGETDESSIVASFLSPGGLVVGSAVERHHALLVFLRHLASRRPVCLVLDDAHHDREVLDFALHVLRRRDIDPLRLLIVLGTRTRTDPGTDALVEELLALAGCRAVPVGPLDAAGCRELVRGVLRLADPLARQVEKRSAGNPFGAVELVADQIARGVLVQGAGGYQLAPGAALELPASLQSLWSGRLDRALVGMPLGSDATVETLAALGAVVDATDWDAACHAAGQPPPGALRSALVAHHLARPLGRSWALESELLRESLELRSRAAGRWEAIHGACAEVLDAQLPAGRGRDRRVGEHLLIAGRLEEAQARLFDAVVACIDAAEYRLASEALDRADAALHAGGAGPDSRLSVLHSIHRAWIARQRGDFETALELLSGTHEVASAQAAADGADLWRDALGRCLYNLAIVARQRGRFDASASYLDEAEVIFDDRRDLRMLGYCGLARAWTCRDRGDLDGAVSAFRAASTRCRSVGDDIGSLSCLEGLGEIARRRGDAVQARGLLERALSEATRLGIRKSVAAILLDVVALDVQQGALDDGLRRVRRAVDLRRQLGNVQNLASALNQLGEVLRAMDRPAEAEAAYRRTLELYAATKSPMGFLPTTNLGLLLVDRGDYEEGEAMLTAALSQVSRQGREQFAGILRRLVGPCVASRGDWVAFDDWLRLSEADERARFDPDLARTAALAARIAHQAGQRRRAHRACLIAVAQWEGLGNPRQAERARRVARGLTTTPGEPAR